MSRTSPRPVAFAPVLTAALATVLLGSGCVTTSPTAIRFEPGSTALAEDQIVIASSMLRGWFIVEAMVGEQGPFELIVDTGASALFLSAEAAAEIDGTYKSRGALSTDATGRSRPVPVMHIDELEMGGVVFRHLDAAVTPIPAWADVDGLVGFAVFRDVTLVLDYPRRRVTLERERLTAGAPGAVPFILRDETPVITARVSGRPLELLVDSGSQDLISINEEEAGSFEFQGGLRPLTMARGSTGSFWQEVGRLAGDVAIGPYLLEEPIVAVDPSPTLLGARLLAEFEVAFDQRSQLLQLRRDSLAPIRCGSIQGTGLVPWEHEGRWVVRGTVPESPAARAGLQAGDEIVTIDGRPVAGRQHREVREMLGRGGAVRLGVARGEERLEVDLTVVELVP